MGVVAALALFSGSAQTDPVTDLMVSPVGGSLICEPLFTTCSRVTSNKNITHIFIAFQQCQQQQQQDFFTVTVDGSPVLPKDIQQEQDDLHNKGGPCNHGPSATPTANDDPDTAHGPRTIETPRFWFPLGQNQFDVTVCVTTDQEQTTRIGAKSADECVQDSVNLCQECQQNPPKECQHSTLTQN
jgi:hypothetical protein